MVQVLRGAWTEAIQVLREDVQVKIHTVSLTPPSEIIMNTEHLSPKLVEVDFQRDLDAAVRNVECWTMTRSQVSSKVDIIPSHTG